MKKYLIILFAFFSVQAFAQEAEQPQENLPESKANSQAIEALKTAYITKELNLTPDEAQKFWPVYNEYLGEMKKAHAELKEDVVALGEKKVTILKKYQENFKKILGTDERVKKCFNAAPRFHQMLRKEWKRRIELHRKNGEGRMPGGKQGANDKQGAGGPPKNGGPQRRPQQPNPGGRS